MHFRKEIPQIQQQLLDCNTREQLDETTSFLQRAIFRCYQKAYKLKKVKQSTKVTWWTQELNIKKKEMRAVQKRANKHHRHGTNKISTPLQPKASSIQETISQSQTNIPEKLLHADERSIRNPI
ncbi:hypothetical protein AVEN_186246-1 [Araneus ventricosus]|uniref:Uncharacterized protein n=1 Tax=Araneus ventricosus TaxID=182803 RepID=A0A4Y2NJZ8_ARAVE|nr:hypothetical protein AVEN_186246-1 [Araneus ventricosus]